MLIKEDVCVEFRIADQNHLNSSGLRNGDLAVTAGVNTGDRVSTWSGYLNIFIYKQVYSINI